MGMSMFGGLYFGAYALTFPGFPNVEERGTAVESISVTSPTREINIKVQIKTMVLLD